VFVAIALVFPVLLLLATLGMERVERPLDRSRVVHQVHGVLDPAPDGDVDVSPETVEKMVADGFRTEVRQYWRRQRLRSSVPKFPRVRGTLVHDATMVHDANVVADPVTPDLSSAPRGG
jgi:hypothetical protein